MSDRYAYWRAALKGDRTGWDHPEAPWPGFYRVRFSRRELWQPVAIWDDPATGETIAVIGQDTRRINPLSIWSVAAFNPVTEEQYRHAVAYGEWWDTLRGSVTSDSPGRPVADVRDAEPILPPSKKRAAHGTI